MDEHVYPAEEERHDFMLDPENLWQEWPGLEAAQGQGAGRGAVEPVPAA